MNSHTPSLANTINLSSLHKSNSRISITIKYLIYTWLCNNAYSSCYFITKRPSHCQPWNVFILQPHSEWPNGISVWVSKRIYSSTRFYDSFSLIWLAGLLISANSLSQYFAICLFLYYNSSWIPNIGAEQLLSQGHHTYAGRSGKSYV